MAGRRENFTVGVPLILDLAHFLEEHRAPVQELPGFLGLAPALLADPDGRAPFAAFSTLWKRVTTRIQHNLIAPWYARRTTAPEEALGACFAAGSSATMFLNRYCHHLSLVNPAVLLLCRSIDDELEVRVMLPERWMEEQPLEADLWGLAQLSDLILQVRSYYPDLKPILLRTRTKPGPVTTALAELAGMPVFPDRSGHSIRFRKAEADARHSLLNPLPALLDAAAHKEWLAAPRPATLQHLREQLAHLADLDPPQRDQVLEAFTIVTRSTLRTTFLATLELTVVFGFSSHQVFSRVFRQKQGTLPREWRKRNAKLVLAGPHAA